LYDLVDDLDLKDVLTKDNKKAFFWYMKAATNNNYLEYGFQPNVDAELQKAKAQYNIGVFYENGDYVNHDFEEAAKWYRLAAERGIIDAQMHLSILLRKHLGKKDESVYWCLKAAEQGDAQAQFNLGVSYFYGDGIGKNIDESIKWLRLAVKNNHPKAPEILFAVEVEVAHGAKH